MKIKLTISVLLVLLTLAFVFKSATENEAAFVPPGPLPGNNITSKFLLGSLHSAMDENFSEVNELGLNMWHRYTLGATSHQLGKNVPMGWIDSDSLTADNNTTYISDVTGILTRVDNNNGMRSLMQRPKIEYLCYGQRSDYQCEADNIDQMLDFYSFNDHNTGMTVPDSGGYAVFCRIQNSTNSGPVWHSAGFVVKRLKCNTEQSKKLDDNQWQGDDQTTWHIKPRIRIDSTVADNPLNFNTPICSLLVKNGLGNTIKTVVLKVRHFVDDFGNYDGRYLDEFKYEPGDDSLLIHNAWGDLWEWRSRGSRVNDDDRSKVDIQVYWYGNCDMWIDRVRVDNDVAHELFRGDYDNTWLQWEADIAAANPSPLKFYIETIEFNNLPCIAYINKKLQSLGANIDMMTDLTHLYGTHVDWGDRATVMNAEHIKRFYIDSAGIKQILFESYPFTSAYYEHPNSTQTFSRIPSTLPVTDGTDILADTLSPMDYDEWLQDNLDHSPYVLEPGGDLDIPSSDQTSPCTFRINSPDQDEGHFSFWMKMGRQISRSSGKPFIYMQQAHQWFKSGEVRREPTIEEMKLLTNLSVSYGVKGIIYYWFPSAEAGTNPECDYTYGIANNYNSGFTKRIENVYGQPKWDSLKRIISKLKTWDPYLMSFDNTQTRSYIYRLERNSLLSETYFYDIASYVRGNDHPICNLDAPDTSDAPPPENLKYECKEDRYLQVATFKTGANDPDNYFMIVNRRCSPLQPVTHDDGERYIRVFFDRNAQQLDAFSNWSIIDLASNEVIDVVDIANVTPYADLGWFDPGAGKLYKMVSTVKSGGILAGDENIIDKSFTCEAPVYNNGHNITIGANTTIHFNDSSRFVMNGGVFTVGDQNTSAPQNITSDAVPGGSWRGHSFTNCEVKIYGATFTGLANDTTYAVNIIDCPVVDIRNCTFNTNSSLKGGVNAVCFDNPFIAINNIYIGSNTFSSSGSTIPTVNVSSYAGVTTPLIIENNTFNEGNTAVFLSGVIGGAIKGNTITDNYIGINALTSSVDVVQNNISSTVSGSMGLFAAGGSELKLNSSGAFTLGGLNTISNEGTGTNNINVDGSYFLLDDGENIFNISTDQSSYHLYGYFPMFTAVPTEETNNCFKVDDSPVDPPINMVTSGYQGTQITFNFNPYLSGCEIIGGGDGLAINLGDGIYDTIYTGGSGSGGSMKEALPLDKGEYPQREGVYNKQTTPSGYAGHPSLVSLWTATAVRGAYVAPAAKTKYDSISVLMRYRNYTQAKTKCLDLINTYPDSIQSIFAISKLFLATVASDTSYNAVNILKIFYENLILNHPGNTSLVKRANYYILKCKVRMREYSQALAGFQQIINQNPYSYEGLIARWDYMATSLLVQGQGGAFSSIDNEQLTMNNYDIDENDDDRKPFTKEQRQDIRKSINTAIEISKNDDETKIKKLEEKSELGDVNASKELTQMKSLKQVVKTEKPKSIIEHVKIVSEDIRKVFGSNTSSKGNEPKNIPLVYKISQNYPNPFNPVTKINYDLPKDSKVKIVIYDILGREVKRLVNNELKTAGSYIVDFNASNYASGVYFYRIEAEEPNGNKFVDSKKMVLLK